MNEETEKTEETEESGTDTADGHHEGAAPLVYEVAAEPTVGIIKAPLGLKFSRRMLLLAGFWTGIAAVGACTAGGGLNLIYPGKVAGFGGTFTPGKVEDFPPGSKTHFIEGRLWIVHLTEEQGGPGLLALWQKCPHLGCTVPWKDDFEFKDPATGQKKQGWFRCPCHGSTYTDAGVRVYGPAPRSMDTMKLTVDENGNVTVDTGDIANGGPDNASRAVKV